MKNIRDKNGRFKKGNQSVSYWAGKKLPEDMKQKIKESNIKSSFWRGKNLPKELVEKLKISRTGDKHWNWKGGITPINNRIRKTSEYKLWRKSVFERDGYTCIWCGYKGNKIQADHIKPFSLFPELRFAIDNGRTLCIDCHKTTDTYGVKSCPK